MLERLVRHAYEQVPFYRERLACLFVNGVVDFSCWNDVPIIDRAEVVASGAAMRTPDLPNLYGAILEMRTSGTTGVPLQIAANELVIVAGNAATTRMRAGSGSIPHDRSQNPGLTPWAKSRPIRTAS